MAKFQDPAMAKAAHKRLLADKFVCRRCKSVKKGNNLKALSGDITCRNCGSHKFKPKRKK
ncbi:hypothetical protein GF342_04760 [Candidatus Woesearchaeota archaeon]|nr:hypothetical protein [Candidatus Woesearchaeota archaeon]